MTDTISIIKDEVRGRILLEQIIDISDRNKTALGFLRPPVFEEALVRGRLWIAVDGLGTYQAHLLFGGVYPTFKIKQLFVSPEARQQGLARRLINEFVSFAEEQGYGSIRARVATDLDANAAWERLGFSTMATVAGGMTTGRTLNVRFRRLMPNGLQTHMLRALDGLPASGQLFAKALPINRSHWYALDLNVWYDFFRRREPFYTAARGLIEAASKGRFRLRFTSEAKQEAERTRGDRDQDPLLAVASAWEAIPTGDSTELDNLVASMREIVFPDRSLLRREAPADTSDLRHLAMSVMAGATGFITRERALLRKEQVLRERYQLEVLEPEDLMEELNEAGPRTSLAGSIKIEPVRAQWDLAARFAKSFVDRPLSRLRALDVDDSGRLCFVGSSLAGLLYWHRTPRGDTEEYLALEPGRADEVSSQQAFDALMGALMAQPNSSGVQRTVLTTAPETGLRFAEDLGRCGFFATKLADVFIRFTVSQGYAMDRWSIAKKVVDRELEVESEWLGDHDERAVLRLRHASGVHDLDRFAFETYFGLTGLTLQGRRMVYIPIREHYANELLPDTPRPTLYRDNEAALRGERVYFRSPASAGTVRRGDLVLFYASAPIKAIIGIARCTTSVVLPYQEATERFRRLAVLEPKEVGNHVHCIAFDNYQAFRSPVSRDWLAQRGALPAQEVISVIEAPATLEPLQVFLHGARHPK